MPFYETVFENGDKAVAEYNDDAEALGAATEHHLRATQGMPANMSLDPGDPARSIAASRVVHLLKYDQHPDDYNPTQTVEVKDAVEVVKAAGNELGMGGLVGVHDLANAIRNMSSPVADEVGPHDSMYKMKEEKDIWKEPVSN